MDRINGAGTVDIGGGRQGFRSEDLPTGVEGTEVTDVWLNAVQENILKVIEEAGLALDANNWSLLWQAIRFNQMADGYFSVTDMRNDPPVGPAIGDRYIVGAVPTGDWVGHEDEIALWLGAWTFIAPTPWMHVGLADRTDWRWDHTLGVPAWVKWQATAADIEMAVQNKLVTADQLKLARIPHIALSSSGDVSCANNANTVLNSLTLIDSSFFLDPASGVASGAVTIGPQDYGLWMIGFVASLVLATAPTGGNEFQARVYKNGSTTGLGNNKEITMISTPILTFQRQFKVDSPSVFDVRVFHNSGTNRNTSSCAFFMHRISGLGA